MRKIFFQICLLLISFSLLAGLSVSAKKGKADADEIRAERRKAEPVTSFKTAPGSLKATPDKPGVAIPVSPVSATAAPQAATFGIDWFVIAAGGTFGFSTDYNMDGTVGQTAVGEGSSTNYSVNAGFWQDFGCCIGIRGDVNGDGDDANILDLTHVVDYMFRGSGDPGPCPEESDVNGDGTPSNIIDLTYLVDFLFRGGPPPGTC